MKRFTTKEMIDTFCMLRMISCLSDGNESDRQKVDQILTIAKDNGGNYECRVTVNGVEIDFERFINSLEESMQTYVADEAKKLLEGHLNQFNNRIRRINDAMDDLASVIEETAEREWKIANATPEFVHRGGGHGDMNGQ